jgi:hypothetical protein
MRKCSWRLALGLRARRLRSLLHQRHQVPVARERLAPLVVLLLALC